MRKISFFLTVILVSLTLLLSACGADQAHTDAPVAIEPAEVVFEPGAWMNIALTDARTGEQFKLSDYGGKVVILEMMDPGCPACGGQVKEVVAALDTLDDKAITVSVDVIGKGEKAQMAWADKFGATWAIAQMPKEFGQSLVKDFGSKIVYPGDTPIIVIDPSGEAHVTEPGIKEAATLVDLVNQWVQ